MKKFMTMILMFCVTLTSFADISVDNTKTNVQTEQNPHYQAGVDFLKNTTMGAGEIAKTGYSVIVRQQVVYAVSYTIELLVGLAFLYGFYFFYKDASTTNNRLLPAIICLVLGGLLLIHGGWHWDQIMVGFINPDYAAIKDIVDIGKDFTTAKTGN